MYKDDLGKYGLLSHKKVENILLHNSQIIKIMLEKRQLNIKENMSSLATKLDPFMTYDSNICM